MAQAVFANNYFYHVFNRGVARQPTFLNKRDYERALTTLDYYRHKKTPLKLAQALSLRKDERDLFFKNLKKEPKLAEIICFCFMPNHFHFLLRQTNENGTSTFLSNFSNSYTRYFNTKRKRNGPLFQGVFKAIRIETDEQLLHVSRYIHLNPIASLAIRDNELDTYPWSSFPEYLSPTNKSICQQKPILDFFTSRKEYRKFVNDQLDYAKKLEEIKHLVLDY